MKLRIFVKNIYKAALITSYFILANLKRILYSITGKNKDSYRIKTNYLIRKNNTHYNDTTKKDEHQDEVYKKMKDFFCENNFSSIIDIGCGSGYKLIKYFSMYDTLGLELPPALDFLKDKYPEKNWQYSDFRNRPKNKFDMAIAIDVIEHLKEPDDLLNFMKKLDCKFIGLSTPDRSKMSFRSNIGPPINTSHVREWSKDEFEEYISNNFRIVISEVVDFQDHYIIAESLKQRT